MSANAEPLAILWRLVVVVVFLAVFGTGHAAAQFVLCLEALVDLEVLGTFVVAEKVGVSGDGVTFLDEDL